MHIFLCNCAEYCVCLQTLIKPVEGGVVWCCWDVSRQNHFGVKPSLIIDKAQHTSLENQWALSWTADFVLHSPGPYITGWVVIFHFRGISYLPGAGAWLMGLWCQRTQLLGPSCACMVLAGRSRTHPSVPFFVSTACLKHYHTLTYLHLALYFEVPIWMVQDSEGCLFQTELRTDIWKLPGIFTASNSLPFLPKSLTVKYEVRNSWISTVGPRIWVLWHFGSSSVCWSREHRYCLMGLLQSGREFYGMFLWPGTVLIKNRKNSCNQGLKDEQITAALGIKIPSLMLFYAGFWMCP